MCRPESNACIQVWINHPQTNARCRNCIGSLTRNEPPFKKKGWNRRFFSEMKVSLSARTPMETGSESRGCISHSSYCPCVVGAPRGAKKNPKQNTYNTQETFNQIKPKAQTNHLSELHRLISWWFDEPTVTSNQLALYLRNYPSFKNKSCKRCLELLCNLSENVS